MTEALHACHGPNLGNPKTAKAQAAASHVLNSKILGGAGSRKKTVRRFALARAGLTYGEVGAIGRASNENADLVHLLVDLSESSDVVLALGGPKSVVGEVERRSSRCLIASDAGESSELNIVATEGTMIIKLDIGVYRQAEVR